MLTLDQHFATGYLPALTGAYFNLVLLLAQNADSPLPSVRRVVNEELPRLKATGEGVKENVRLVQALAEIAGFEPPPPPSTPDAYFDWFEAVHAGFRARLETHHRGEIAHALGHAFGDLLCSWNVATMVVRLLVADSESPSLEQQWSALREDLLDTRDKVLIHGHHPNTPPALAALADRFSDAVDDLLGWEIDAGEAELSKLGRWLDATMRSLAHEVSEARVSLRGEDTAGEA